MSEAQSAGMQDYWRGGTEHSPADRAAAEHAMAAYPGLAASVKANRAFLGRSVRFLAGEVGLRQFLDVGTGVLAKGSVHEVAPGRVVVYCDSDPAVVARGREVLGGESRYIEADLRQPAILLDRAAQAGLDVTQPVAVTLVSVLHLIEDSAGPHAIVAELMSALPAGSFLSLTHVASDLEPEAMAEMTRRVNEHLARPATPRDHVTVTRFFAGLDLVPPGLVRVPQWRPDSPEEALSPSAQWGGVARKPS
jgi:S-adenosyl methyltransferase